MKVGDLVLVLSITNHWTRNIKSYGAGRNTLSKKGDIRKVEFIDHWHDMVYIYLCDDNYGAFTYENLRLLTKQEYLTYKHNKG
jgi:hypothetical protein